ncbi:MAG: universal stress protein [Acidimicrobiales bacterium]|jgi:nucleotide-binding universal stress UspA family protein
MSAPRRIVVGVDGSPCARRALSWALDTAAALGAEVVAVHALGLLTHLGAATEPAESHRRNVQQAFDEEWCAPLHTSAVPNQRVLVDGNPVTALLAAVGDFGADLVVVGSRGHGGFPGLQLGSTSHQLVQHATTPVVVVPPDAP